MILFHRILNATWRNKVYFLLFDSSSSLDTYFRYSDSVYHLNFHLQLDWKFCIFSVSLIANHHWPRCYLSRLSRNLHRLLWQDQRIERQYGTWSKYRHLLMNHILRVQAITRHYTFCLALEHLLQYLRDLGIQHLDPLTAFLQVVCSFAANVLLSRLLLDRVFTRVLVPNRKVRKRIWGAVFQVFDPCDLLPEQELQKVHCDTMHIFTWYLYLTREAFSTFHYKKLQIQHLSKHQVYHLTLWCISRICIVYPVHQTYLYYS